MGRWEPNARGRLEQAALELYVERGFEQTTVAEIAERAGLTERTFFRHFADKREVLFAGAGALQELLVTRRRRRARVGGADRRGRRGPRGRRRPAPGAPRLLPAAPGRHRRERGAPGARADQARLTRRGARRRAAPSAASPSPAASLTAEAGIAVFKVAFERWINETGQPDLPRLIRESLDELKAVTAGG